MSDRALTHIKTMAEALKEEQPEKLAQPAGLFISGMLTGLAASAQILNGSTAEAEAERVEVNLAAAIGNAYLNGTLPSTPPHDPADELRKVNALLQDLGVEGELGAQGMAALANTVRCMREELRRAEMAIARVRLVKKAPSRSPHNLHANAQDDGWDQALDAVHNALGTPECCTTKNAGKDHPVHELLAALTSGLPHPEPIDLIHRYYNSIHELCCPYDHAEPRPVYAAAANRAALDELAAKGA